MLRNDVPLLVGTWAPQLSAFAGAEADELKVGGSAHPDVVLVMRERIANPDVGIVLGAVTVVDDDGERARQIARREVAMYFAVVAELDPTVEAEAVFAAGARRVDFGIPHGSPERRGVELLCTGVLPRLRAAG